MTRLKPIIKATLLVALSLGLASCGDDDATHAINETGTGGADGGAAGVCDPVGLAPAVGALLNAPVAADVEVIQKTPQHPGPAGPTDLP